MIEQLTQNTETQLSMATFLFNIGIGMILSLVLQWHFKYFGGTLSNRDEFGQVFPFLLLTTLLIITVVKSSLALSLGLVGALSIVRFRTPIKEPEELAYLFMAIAMGLGLGANQTAATLVAGFTILAFMACLKITRHTAKNKNLFLSIDWPKIGEESSSHLEGLTEVLGKHSRRTDLRRFDVRNGSLEATYFVDIENLNHVSQMVTELKSKYPDIGVTFLDQSQMPSV